MSDCGSLAHMMWAMGERDTPWPDAECWGVEACAHHRTAADDEEREARWERAIADSLIREGRQVERVSMAWDRWRVSWDSTQGDPVVGTDALEPPTDLACPDCRAEAGVPCTWACSSRWT